ncbi:MAG: DUF2752 domain-containing protein [Acetatifactor sp.]|nr:DUF2752 domain-containing protein [Acetatifactor sp.]MDE7352316.1 DUF2752 domain-containing protein [Acetatifactor sp.]
MKKKADLETELFHIGLIFLAAGAVLWTGYCLIREQLPQLPCVVSSLLGIYCPGCGGTRAFVCLLHGKLLLSLWYHPLIPYTAVLFGGFMITQSLNRLGLRRIRGWKFHRWYLYAGIVIVAGNFVVKNLLRLVWGIVMI